LPPSRPRAGSPLLEARGISHAFGRRTVLRDVTLAVGAGTIAGVVGENGTGKTTLLRVLAGLLNPDAGEVRLAGRLGYCPQEPELFQLLTVQEHFHLFASALGPPATTVEKMPRGHEHGRRFDGPDVATATRTRMAAVFNTDARNTTATLEMVLSTHRRREVRYTAVNTRHMPKAFRPATLPEKASWR
jgi:ATPase subunit of ABC transporter with duplicated ATPase domains